MPLWVSHAFRLNTLIHVKSKATFSVLRKQIFYFNNSNNIDNNDGDDGDDDDGDDDDGDDDDDGNNKFPRGYLFTYR